MTDIDAVCEVVIQAKNDEIEKLLTELVAARPIVAAAKEWRACFDDEGEICNRIALGDTEVKLIDAIDAARGEP